MIEPLPPELAKLLAAERAAPLTDQTLRAVVRTKVAATLAGAPLGASVGAGAAGLGLAKIVTIIAVVVGAGTVALVKLQSSSPQLQSRAMPSVPRAETSPSPVVPAPLQESPDSVAAPIVASPPRAIAASATQPTRKTPSQARLLKQAWSELSNGNAARALELAILDGEVHEGGPLSEEREALRVVALAKLGRTVEARKAGAVFSAKYANSVHHETIVHALAGGPR